MFPPLYSQKSKLRYGLVAAGLFIFFTGAIIYTRLRAWPVSSNPAGPDVEMSSLSDPDEDGPVPVSVTTTPQEVAVEPRDTSALGGYNVLIADRGNNRLVEVSPDKKIIWEYTFDLPKLGLGADDSFFADNGKTVIVNLEEYHVLELIDYATKKVIWSYGVPGKPGHLPGQLNTPDDAYKLPNGDIIVADIKNCRVIEITPDKQILHQYGHTKQCANRSGFLNEPNGDTPLPNGHILISTIRDRNLVELNEEWQPVFSMKLPVGYPSDPQLTRAGNILISDYRNPGQIVEVSRRGEVVWQYGGDATTTLNKPSLAIELPNGNILANDDFNHRIIVIDKATKQIVWQYGVTGKPGADKGQLNIPDGMDIIKVSSQANTTPVALPPWSTVGITTLHTVGQVTRHAGQFVYQHVRIQGYLLQKNNGYIIFSDEPTGVIGRYDLPVVGAGTDTMQSGKKYELQGTFLGQGLVSSNHNPDHLELDRLPVLAY